MRNMPRGLSEAGRSLEDAFFIRQDAELIEELRTMRKLEETKKNLAQASGIRNEAVLQKFVDLDIHPETIASLGLVPLVEVAWASGEVHKAERDAVMKAVQVCGFCRKGEEDYKLLDRWMTHRPDRKLLDAWTHYVHGLRDVLNEKEYATLRDELLLHSRTVAEAAGGFLGMGSRISAGEEAMLRKIEAAFK